MKVSHLVIINLLSAGQAYREAENALSAVAGSPRQTVGQSRVNKLIDRRNAALNRLHQCEDLARSYVDQKRED